MIVLLLTEGLRSADAIQAAFTAHGHAVLPVKTLRGANDFIAKHPPDVLVAAWQAGAAHLDTLRQAVIARGRYVYVLAVVDQESPEAFCGALEAGADAVIAASATAADLNARRVAAERTIHAEHALRSRLIELERALRASHEIPAGAPAAGGPGPARVLLKRAWERLEDTLARMCTEYLHEVFIPIPAATPPAGPVPACTVTLTDVVNAAQVELAFVVPKAALPTVAALFCGDASIVDDEVIKDVMNELANSGMGVVKAAFFEEGLTLTGSIPKHTTLEPAKFVAGTEAMKVLAYRRGDTVVHVLAVLRDKARVRLLGHQLKEGMVVVADVQSAAGVLLARAGTRLTSSAAAGLARLVPKKEIEIAEAN